MRDSTAVQKEIQWLFGEVRIKVVGIKRKEDQRCPKVTIFLNWIHFFDKTFIHAKDSDEFAKYEKKDEGSKERTRITRDPRTRHPPIYITSSIRAFSSNLPSFADFPCFSFHCLFARLCSLRRVEDDKSLRDLTLFKTKISISLPAGFCILLLAITWCQYFIKFFA